MQSIETIVNKACQRHDELIKQLTNELKDTKDELRLVQNDLNQLEQYGKRRDLLIYGISYTKDENVTDIVLKLGNTLGLTLKENDFNAIHRLPPTKNSVDKTKQSIIVSFLRFTDRNAFYSSRKRCRDHDEFKNVFINEHLTYYNNQIFVHARKHLDKKRIFTRNGNVFLYVDKGKYKQLYSTLDIDNALNNLTVTVT
ncbi:unnamed protein product [Didymodactylos carnosus]|uniref:Uncharacterized protein n=1 Tax=Didymodactylos carnosus TaxID=1234261 RepID=A0A8S2DJ09_9BILA|nr:unnamed protein product [Didymodactylos carnosus]CAF3695635.1 unnamed protein product [Didymodactylos carnosus]